jgi:hypothetical protein
MNPVALQIMSDPKSLETSPMTHPKNLPTPEKEVTLQILSKGEKYEVHRPDLKATIYLQLDSEQDEPRWILGGVFSELETAIRFIERI